MFTLHITMCLDNAAFYDDLKGEIQRQLNLIVASIPAGMGECQINVQDVNGNTTTSARIEKRN